jgi:type I restriction enzyme M protein
MDVLRRIPIPMPDLATQRQIVSSMESERELIQSNRKLIKIYEKKIQDKLAEIWGENEA